MNKEKEIEGYQSKIDRSFKDLRTYINNGNTCEAGTELDYLEFYFVKLNELKEV
jgi:hypothetical protein